MSDKIYNKQEKTLERRKERKARERERIKKLDMQSKERIGKKRLSH